MRRSPIRSNIRPKISSMPRQKSEASAYLDIYKLVVEKKRLQQELESIEQRRVQISDRLNVINAKVDSLEGRAHQLRDADDGGQAPSTSSLPPRMEKVSQFETLTLEY
ncbi:MAG: hypothetical protein VKL39_08995 [Leptolyngbyaceae bacterium]|nr:hypothetical protein [Leptolyngbyaceae bacterium]